MNYILKLGASLLCFLILGCQDRSRLEPLVSLPSTSKTFAVLVTEKDQTLPLQGLYQTRPNSALLGLIWQHGPSLGTCSITEHKISCQSINKAVPASLLKKVAQSVICVLNLQKTAENDIDTNSNFCQRHKASPPTWHCQLEETKLTLILDEPKP